MKDFVRKLVSQLELNGDISSHEAEDMIDEFKNRSKEAFDTFLVSQGLVPKDRLLKALSQVFDMPYFDVVGHFFERDLLRHFPMDFLFAHNIIPIQQDGDVLTMVAADPDDPELREEISRYSNSAVEFRVGLKRDIQNAIREYYDTSVTNIKGVWSEDPGDDSLASPTVKETDIKDIFEDE